MGKTLKIFLSTIIFFFFWRTPSKDHVHPEPLSTDCHGSDDKQMKVDALYQHPEEICEYCVVDKAHQNAAQPLREKKKRLKNIKIHPRIPTSRDKSSNPLLSCPTSKHSSCQYEQYEWFGTVCTVNLSALKHEIRGQFMEVLALENCPDWLPISTHVLNLHEATGTRS